MGSTMRSFIQRQFDWIALNDRKYAFMFDKDTSGVVLVVKDRRLDAEVTRSFFRREVRKTYLALVHGVVIPEALRSLRRRFLPWLGDNGG